MLCWVLIYRTSAGFASRVTGGNIRAAQLQGLPVTKLILLACAMAAAAPVWPGAIEVAAEYGRANASLNAGYGYTGILIASWLGFNPLAIMPMAFLLGGLARPADCCNGAWACRTRQSRCCKGLIFVSILTSDTLYGRFRWFQPREPPDDGRHRHRPAGHARRQPAGQHAVPVRQPGRVPDRKIRPHQPRQRRRTGPRRDGRLRNLL